MNIELNTRLTPLAILISGALLSGEGKAQEDLEHVVVSGSSYTLMADSGASAMSLSKEDIDRMPHLADDVFRLLPYLPGVSAGDYSASFNIRGGATDEVLVMLDGQELYRPFHMKSFNGAFSIVDTENVGGMNFSSGGYGARYGNRMSGVLDITSLDPTEDTQYSVGASFINARAGAQGSFANGRGRWLVSGRRGYLDMILNAIEDDSNKFEPIYADLFSKVEYDLNDNHQISAHLLYAYDDEVMVDEYDEPDGRRIKENISGKYSSTYFWINLDSALSDNIEVLSKLSVGEIDEDRNGGDTDPLDLSIQVKDYRKLQFTEFKQDLTYHFSDSQIWQLGWNFETIDVHYDYDSTRELFFGAAEPISRRDIRIDKDGNEYSAYINHKMRLTDNLVSELGFRFDKQTYMGFDDDQSSPRVSLAWNLLPESTLRLSWGYYHQAQDILSLQVNDGITEYAKAQQAEHRIISFETRLSKNMTLRAEAWQKEISDPLVRFENLYDPFPLFPEGQRDRVRVAPQSAEIKGIEISLTHQINRKMSWTGNYTWSEARDLIDGRDIARSWDQEHALNTAFNYDFDSDWNLNIAYVFHSGWPTTAQFASREQQADGSYRIVSAQGDRNQLNLGDYQRIDFRLSKEKQLDNGVLTMFLEVTNLLSRDNECCVADPYYQVNADGSVSVIQERDYWLPLIPSLGVRYQF